MVLSQYHVTNRVTKYLFMRRDSIDKTALRKVSSCNTLRNPIDRVLEKPMCCLILDLKTKLITSEATFMRSLSRVVV